MSLPFIFLLFISWGTGSAVQISWLAKHKDEQRGTTFWAHRYQPLANGFSVLLDTDINGSIWTDQTNLTSPISFQIDHVINVSGMALTEAEISEPFTGKAIDWANQYTPANQISDFFGNPNITLTNNTVLLKVEFMPKGLSSPPIQPWELMLLFQVDGWCDFSWWSHYKKCATSFALILYGLKAQLNGSDADGGWNSTDEHGQKSNGFMCNQIYLRFPNPNNTTQSELSFNNLKMSVYLDLDTLPNTVSSLHMNVCGSDTLQSSCMMSWLAYNWTMLLFCMILMGVAVAITHKIYMSRQRITTRYNIAAASNPFSLEDFDDVDVWTPFENGKRKKNLPKMIY